MNGASKAMTGALALDVAILAPVVPALLTGWPFEARHLGPRTEGLLVLTSIYAAIAIVSAGLIVLHLRRAPWAIPMTVALFAVQIVYKAITVPLVGPGNPVVLANLAVMVVEAAILLGLWRGRGRVRSSSTP